MYTICILAWQYWNANGIFSRSRFLKIENDGDVFILVGRELKIIGPI